MAIGGLLTAVGVLIVGRRPPASADERRTPGPDFGKQSADEALIADAERARCRCRNSKLALHHYTHQDHLRASLWFRRRRSREMPSRNTIVGALYAVENADRNYDRAAEWYRKARTKRWRPRWANWRCFMSNGWGVPKSMGLVHTAFLRGRRAGRRTGISVLKNRETLTGYMSGNRSSRRRWWMR